MILGISYFALLWLLAAIILAVIEAETQGLVSLWFSIGAVATFFVALAGAPVMVHFIVFVLVSMVLLLSLRPLTKKYIKVKTVKTNADRFVGKVGEVIQEINAIKGGGQVKVEGQIWTAQAIDGSDLSVGTLVGVEGISGVKLMVKKVEK